MLVYILDITGGPLEPLLYILDIVGVPLNSYCIYLILQESTWNSYCIYLILQEAPWNSYCIHILGITGGPLNCFCIYLILQEAPWNSYCIYLILQESPWNRYLLVCNYAVAGNLQGGTMYTAGLCCTLLIPGSFWDLVVSGGYLFIGSQICRGPLFCLFCVLVHPYIFDEIDMTGNLKCLQINCKSNGSVKRFSGLFVLLHLWQLRYYFNSL